MSKRIKVARVSTVPFFVVTQLSAPIQALADSGAEVVIVASDDALGGNVSGLDCAEYVPIHIARDIDPLSDLRSLARLIKLFRERRFDIVHSTTPKAGLLCAIAGCVSRVPVRLHSFTGQPWVTMTGLKRTILKACDRIIGVLNTRCHTDSNSQRQFLINEKIIKPEKIAVLGEGSLAGVNLQRFNAQRYEQSEKASLKADLGINEDSTVLLFVGRITKDKGVGELLDAFVSLVRKGKKVDLILVGPYESDGESIVSKYCSSPEIAARVKRTGFSDEPEKYMAVSNILCLPSYREGFGTVVIEAAAMGLPTVGTEIYGLTDAVVSNVTGTLVPVRDASALENALGRLIDDPLLLETMAKAANQRAVDSFDSMRYSQLLIDEYKSLLKS